MEYNFEDIIKKWTSLGFLDEVKNKRNVSLALEMGVEYLINTTI